MSKAAELAALIGSQTALSNRNLIINGAMQVAQRGTSTTGVTGIGYQAVDRWENAINTAGTYTISQDTNAPDGFSSSLKYLCTVADASLAADDYVTFRQKLEGQNVQHLNYGSSGAKTVTASFWVKSNVTGTYTLSLEQESPASYFNVHTYTINSADTWEYKTISFAGHVSTAITNNNATGLELQHWLASGSTFSSGTVLSDTWTQTTANRVSSSQVNLSSAVNNYWQITGAQLEVGEQATPFEHRSIGDELLRCQRYYQRLSDNHGNSAVAIASGVSYSTTSHYFVFHHTVPMRAAFTLGYSSVSDIRVYTQGTSAAFSALARNGGTDTTSEINGSTSSGIGTAGNGVWFRAGSTAYVDFDAEL